MGIEILGTLIATLATIVAGILANFVSSRVKAVKFSSPIDFEATFVDDGAKVKEPETLDQKRRRLLKTRMDEVGEAVKRHDRDARINKWSNNLLIAGQYVVGGTLASSFIQESLTNELVGILGLIVLVATIVHQRYRPDLKSRIARAKVSLLRSTLRKTQDDMVSSDNPDLTKIISKLSRALNKVDEDEEWELEDEPVSNNSANE